MKYSFIAFVNLLENIFSMEAELAKAFPLLLCWYHGCLPLPPHHHAEGSNCLQTLREAQLLLRPGSRFRVSPERLQCPRDGLCHAWSSQSFCVPVATKGLCAGYSAGVLDEQMGVCTLHACSLSLFILFTSIVLVWSSELSTVKSQLTSVPLWPALKSTAFLPWQKRKKTH